MEKLDVNNFLILFRDLGCQFRFLYIYCLEIEEINKLIGIGFKFIIKKMIEGFYKYNFDRKQFSYIFVKILFVSVDAIIIYSYLWQIKRLVILKKFLFIKVQVVGDVCFRIFVVNLYFVFFVYRKIFLIVNKIFIN